MSHRIRLEGVGCLSRGWQVWVAVLGLAWPLVAGAVSPNVIVILTDDQGAADAHCYGSADLATPAIDALAARGLRFTQFYSGAPVCSPSRAAVLTGRYPLRAGMPGNAPSRRGLAGLPPQPTLAKMFQAAGYRTGHIGKWHLGFTPETMPNGQGFDESFGHMGGCIDNFSHFFYWEGPNRHDLFRNGQEIHQPGRFFPDLMVEEGRRFLAENKDRPFFLYFALNLPHYPYQGDPKWLEHYRDLPHPRNLYAAFVSTLDERIGALVKAVDDLGLRERTILVFQSDNGHSIEERAHGGGGSAGPYRGAKFSLFEGGIRLPAILSWPGQVPAGEVREQVAHAGDWMPTLAELCGVKLLDADIDGRSLVPVLRSAAAPTPHEVLHWQTGQGRKAQWAVRQGEWKLMANLQDTAGGPLSAEDKTLFLANLAADLGETRNLARERPDIVSRLSQLHQTWLDGVKPPPSAPAEVRDQAGNER